MANLSDKLILKSKEAFIMAVEIYNKPTIKYRVEGFSFFICNAWELMLKAHMLKKFGEKSIYYRDNDTRTKSLENCIKEVFTNQKAPLRMNLEKIIELRNTSTHFITEEYEMVYIPLFQSCLFNFSEKIKEFHGVDMTEVIPQNFLTLSVSMKSLNYNEIRAKYPEEIANRLINSKDKLNELIEENNSGFAIKIEHNHYITKNKSEADSIVAIDNKSVDKVKIVKDLKDPNDTHKFNMKKCLEEINKRLKKEGMEVDDKFNQYHFRLFIDYFELKKNRRYCYVNTIQQSPQYSYSIQAIDFIVEEIKKDPENIIQNLKDKLRNKK